MVTPVASTPDGVVTPHSRYWLVPVSRAVAAAVAAVVITFSRDHSPWLGLSVFAGFAVVTGLVLLLPGARRLPDDRVTRRAFQVQGLVSLVAGGAAVALLPFAGMPAFFGIVSAWALITGALEAYCGHRVRGRTALARDWTIVGWATVLLAVAFFVVPQGLDEQFTGPDGVARSLTASIVTVGIFGAYAAIIAMLLAIGGFSLKWGADETGRVSPETESHR